METINIILFSNSHSLDWTILVIDAPRAGIGENQRLGTWKLYFHWTFGRLDTNHTTQSTGIIDLIAGNPLDFFDTMVELLGTESGTVLLGPISLQEI